jgi:hypothetical protein
VIINRLKFNKVILIVKLLLVKKKEDNKNLLFLNRLINKIKLVLVYLINRVINYQIYRNRNIIIMLIIIKYIKNNCNKNNNNNK